jgi:hypothetical protein
MRGLIAALLVVAWLLPDVAEAAIVTAADPAPEGYSQAGLNKRHIPLGRAHKPRRIRKGPKQPKNFPKTKALG